MYKGKMKREWAFVALCAMLTACGAATESEKPEEAREQTEEMQVVPEVKGTERKAVAAPVEEVADTADEWHALIRMRTVAGSDGCVDTVYHYPTGRKIRIGSHQGHKLYVELGEFYDDRVYDGARLYWGDSLIYATKEELTNDWQTCRVCHVPGAGVTYVLLMINNRPFTDFWHIVRLDDKTIHLTDRVLAGNDYIEGASYFHNAVIYGDLDGDGIVEVGGKRWTELWADSMTYCPCYIYKLGPELRLDEALSERETRRAYGGLFLGLDDGLRVYNPNEEQHEEGAGPQVEN